MCPLQGGEKEGGGVREMRKGGKGGWRRMEEEGVRKREGEQGRLGGGGDQVIVVVFNVGQIRQGRQCADLIPL